MAGRSFEALVDDVIDFHPELAFLRDNKVFRNRYVETVIIRIFYTINRTPPPLEADVISGKARGLTFKDFAKSDLYDTIVNLPNIEINDVPMETINLFQCLWMYYRNAATSLTSITLSYIASFMIWI